VKPERLAQVKGRTPEARARDGMWAVATMLADPDAMAHTRRSAAIRHRPKHCARFSSSVCGRHPLQRDRRHSLPPRSPTARRWLFHAEDIGRHNAVDKVIGAAVLARTPIVGRGLLVTGAFPPSSLQSGTRRTRVGGHAERASTLAVTIARAIGNGARRPRGQRHPDMHKRGSMTGEENGLRDLLRRARTLRS